jgi:hypothetical protein
MTPDTVCIAVRGTGQKPQRMQRQYIVYVPEIVPRGRMLSRKRSPSKWRGDAREEPETYREFAFVKRRGPSAFALAQGILSQVASERKQPERAWLFVPAYCFGQGNFIANTPKSECDCSAVKNGFCSMAVPFLRAAAKATSDKNSK